MNESGGSDEIVYGVLGTYVSTPEDDECYGLYLRINQQPVFVDLREDTFLEERKFKAQQLFSHSEQLERSLEILLLDNPEFRSRKIACLGLHSKNTDQAEVFWEPTGYTLLKGLSFVLE
jgi:hypothetical protein